MPLILGSTTERVKAAATAASMALPPAASILTPAVVAKGWAVVTIPFLDRTTLFCGGCFISPE